MMGLLPGRLVGLRRSLEIGSAFQHGYVEATFRLGNPAPANSEVWLCLEILISWTRLLENLMEKWGDWVSALLKIVPKPHTPQDVPSGVFAPSFPTGLPFSEDSLCWSLHTAAKLMFALLIDINDLPFTAQHHAEHIPINWVGGVKLSASICHFSA